METMWEKMAKTSEPIDWIPLGGQGPGHEDMEAQAVTKPALSIALPSKYTIPGSNQSLEVRGDSQEGPKFARIRRAQGGDDGGGGAGECVIESISKCSKKSIPSLLLKAPCQLPGSTVVGQMIQKSGRICKRLRVQMISSHSQTDSIQETSDIRPDLTDSNKRESQSEALGIQNTSNDQGLQGQQEPSTLSPESCAPTNKRKSSSDPPSKSTVSTEDANSGPQLCMSPGKLLEHPDSDLNPNSKSQAPGFPPRVHSLNKDNAGNMLRAGGRDHNFFPDATDGDSSDSSELLRNSESLEVEVIPDSNHHIRMKFRKKRSGDIPDDYGPGSRNVITSITVGDELPKARSTLDEIETETSKGPRPGPKAQHKPGDRSTIPIVHNSSSKRALFKGYRIPSNSKAARKIRLVDGNLMCKTTVGMVRLDDMVVSNNFRLTPEASRQRTGQISYSGSPCSSSPPLIYNALCNRRSSFFRADTDCSNEKFAIFSDASDSEDKDYESEEYLKYLKGTEKPTYSSRRRISMIEAELNKPPKNSARKEGKEYFLRPRGPSEGPTLVHEPLPTYREPRGYGRRKGKCKAKIAKRKPKPRPRKKVVAIEPGNPPKRSFADYFETVLGPRLALVDLRYERLRRGPTPVFPDPKSAPARNKSISKAGASSDGSENAVGLASRSQEVDAEKVGSDTEIAPPDSGDGNLVCPPQGIYDPSVCVWQSDLENSTGPEEETETLMEDRDIVATALKAAVFTSNQPEDLFDLDIDPNTPTSPGILGIASSPKGSLVDTLDLTIPDSVPDQFLQEQDSRSVKDKLNLGHDQVILSGYQESRNSGSRSWGSSVSGESNNPFDSLDMVVSHLNAMDNYEDHGMTEDRFLMEDLLDVIPSPTVSSPQNSVGVIVRKDDDLGEGSSISTSDHQYERVEKNTDELAKDTVNTDEISKSVVIMDMDESSSDSIIIVYDSNRPNGNSRAPVPDTSLVPEETDCIKTNCIEELDELMVAEIIVGPSEDSINPDATLEPGSDLPQTPNQPELLRSNSRKSNCDDGQEPSVCLNADSQNNDLIEGIESRLVEGQKVIVDDPAHEGTSNNFSVVKDLTLTLSNECQNENSEDFPKSEDDTTVSSEPESEVNPETPPEKPIPASGDALDEIVPETASDSVDTVDSQKSPNLFQESLNIIGTNCSGNNQLFGVDLGTVNPKERGTTTKITFYADLEVSCPTPDTEETPSAQSRANRPLPNSESHRNSSASNDINTVVSKLKLNQEVQDVEGGISNSVIKDSRESNVCTKKISRRKPSTTSKVIMQTPTVGIRVFSEPLFSTNSNSSDSHIKSMDAGIQNFLESVCTGKDRDLRYIRNLSRTHNPDLREERVEISSLEDLSQPNQRNELQASKSDLSKNPTPVLNKKSKPKPQKEKKRNQTFPLKEKQVQSEKSQDAPGPRKGAKIRVNNNNMSRLCCQPSLTFAGVNTAGNTQFQDSRSIGPHSRQEKTICSPQEDNSLRSNLRLYLTRRHSTTEYPSNNKRPRMSSMTTEDSQETETASETHSVDLDPPIISTPKSTIKTGSVQKPNYRPSGVSGGVQDQSPMQVERNENQADITQEIRRAPQNLAPNTRPNSSSIRYSPISPALDEHPRSSASVSQSYSTAIDTRPPPTSSASVPLNPSLGPYPQRGQRFPVLQEIHSHHPTMLARSRYPGVPRGQPNNSQPQTVGPLANIGPHQVIYSGGLVSYQNLTRFESPRNIYTRPSIQNRPVHPGRTQPMYPRPIGPNLTEFSPNSIQPGYIVPYQNPEAVNPHHNASLPSSQGNQSNTTNQRVTLQEEYWASQQPHYPIAHSQCLFAGCDAHFVDGQGWGNINQMTNQPRNYNPNRQRKQIHPRVRQNEPRHRNSQPDQLSSTRRAHQSQPIYANCNMQMQPHQVHPLVGTQSQDHPNTVPVTQPQRNGPHGQPVNVIKPTPGQRMGPSSSAQIAPTSRVIEESPNLFASLSSPALNEQFQQYPTTASVEQSTVPISRSEAGSVPVPIRTTGPVPVQPQPSSSGSTRHNQSSENSTIYQAQQQYLATQYQHFCGQNQSEIVKDIHNLIFSRWVSSLAPEDRHLVDKMNHPAIRRYLEGSVLDYTGIPGAGEVSRPILNNSRIRLNTETINEFVSYQTRMLNKRLDNFKAIRDAMNHFNR